MDKPVTAIEMTGIVDEHSRLKLDGPLPFAGPKRVKVIILSETDSEIDELSWLRAATCNPAFEFLADPAEDIYSIEDGQPFKDEV